jgi:hypothetical protein
LLGGAVLALGGCSKIEPSETLRYRLTVTVETPEGVKSGYSVWAYTITDIAIGFTPQSRDHRGEAVAVDLPGGRTLFALLVSGNGQSDYPEYVIEDKLRATPEYQENSETAFLSVFSEWQSTRESWEVKPFNQDSNAPSGYPMLVTFKDIKDPTSVQRVDPDDLAASFGKGYRLKAITVQVTDDPVTVGIQKRLGWLSPHPEPSLNPKHGPTDFSVSATVTHGDFRRGATQ